MVVLKATASLRCKSFGVADY